MAKFAPLESARLISRKIWVIEKSWHFHTVLSQFFHTVLVSYIVLPAWILKLPISRPIGMLFQNPSYYFSSKSHINPILATYFYWKILFFSSWKMQRRFYWLVEIGKNNDTKVEVSELVNHIDELSFVLERRLKMCIKSANLVDFSKRMKCTKFQLHIISTQKEM